MSNTGMLEGVGEGRVHVLLGLHRGDHGGVEGLGGIGDVEERGRDV